MAARDRTSERTSTQSTGPTLTRMWTWVVGLAGAALAAAAAVDLIVGEGDGTIVALVFVGVFLALGPVLLPRIVRGSVGVHGFTFELARSIAELGAEDTARRVDRWGGGLTEAADAYATAHTVLSGYAYADARTRLQDHFVEEAAASALVQQYDADEVRALFRNAPPVVRVLVLGLMQGDPSLADAATIEAAITQSRTANEQYQGLRLAKVVGPRLRVDDRRRLRAAIAADPMIRKAHDRSTLSAEVLVLLADDEGPNGSGGEDERRGPAEDVGAAAEPTASDSGDSPGRTARRAGKGSARAS